MRPFVFDDLELGARLGLMGKTCELPDGRRGPQGIAGKTGHDQRCLGGREATGERTAHNERSDPDSP
jgi:hypothetical protein